MEQNLQKLTETLPLEKRCSFSPEQLQYMLPMLIILDTLDNTAMIVDNTTHIRYFNHSYLHIYGEHWNRVGIPSEKILNIELNAQVGPNYHDMIPLTEVLKHDFNTNNYYYTHPGSDMDGFADLIKIDTDYFHGAAVIQTSNTQISELSASLSYYKTLYQQTKLQITSKDNLPPRFQQITGNSPQFLRTLQLAAQVSKTSSSVCILGESGTGKEVLAEAIHYSSNYVNGPFIRVNCAAIPESLMESELFGYEKGAFTGSSPGGKAGKFELANNGTLFLDEIGEMPLSMQVKLLRALQEREITRIGGSKPIKLNFRLITATNRDLEKMMAEGTFREDIYYRICIIPLMLPPLRERRTDIPLLADMFLDSLDIPQWENRHFSAEVMDHFLHYSWPGNIRELKNCVERMAILCPEEEISAEYLPASIIKAKKAAPSAIQDPDTYNLKELIEKTEYDAIKSVLSLTQGNKAKAIEILGISKRNFYMKLEKFGLK